MLTFNEAMPHRVEALQHTLAGHPNGTPLCCATRVPIRRLSRWCDVYWLDHEMVTQERIDRILCYEEITAFEKIAGMSISIYDAQWEWSDEWIDAMMLECLCLPHTPS